MGQPALALQDDSCDDGEDDWVDGVFCQCVLEVAVVLGAGGADAAVELGEGYVEDVREGEEGGVQPSPVMPVFTWSSDLGDGQWLWSGSWEGESMDTRLA